MFEKGCWAALEGVVVKEVFFVVFFRLLLLHPLRHLFVSGFTSLRVSR